MAIGENIRRLRRDKQLTQGELADITGISSGQISKLESNKDKPGLETIYALIKGLECSPNSLLNDASSMGSDGLLEMAMERVLKLSEEDRMALLRVIDNYCLAVAYQGLLSDEKPSLFGVHAVKGKTEGLAGR